MADLTYAAPAATVGATYVWNIALQDSITGLPPSLAGYTGDLQIRAAPSSPIILEASTTNSQMALNTPPGNVAINFPPISITQFGTFIYELKLVDGSGNVSKPVGGPFVINPTITP